VIFFLVAILFWGAYEQAGSTLTLFADRYTRLEILGFASAGIGMALGLTQYVAGKKRLQAALDRLAAAPRIEFSAGVPINHSPEPAVPATGQGLGTMGLPARMSSEALGFTSREWKRMGAIVIFFLVAILFWGAYEQAGSTLTLFADRYTRLEMLGVSYPSS